MKKHIPFLLFAAALLAWLLAACGAPQLPASPVAQATIALTPTPTATFTPTPSPTFTPTPTATFTPTSTPTPAAKAQSRATAQPAKPLTTATPSQLVLIITEKEANRMAAEALAQQQEVQIDNPRVDFRPGAMYVSGDTVLGFFKLNIGILATVEAVDGQPQVAIQEIDVNGERATGFIRNQIEALIAPHLDQLATVSEDFYVEDITITDEKMVITGRPQ